MLNIAERFVLQFHNWLDCEKSGASKPKRWDWKNVSRAKELKGGDGEQFNKATQLYETIGHLL